MSNVNDAISGAKFLIDYQIKTDGNYHSLVFEGYQKGFLFTNEDIKAYLDLVNFEGKENALSVLASGDQVFSLISKGILNIDTFDINKLQPYLALGLKKAAILKYSYLEYLEIIKKFNDPLASLEEISSIIFDLLPYMEKDYTVFWKSIVGYNYRLQSKNKKQLNLIAFLSSIELGMDSYSERVSFLESEEKYNALRNSLVRANISFKPANANSLGEKFNENHYDFVLLSNILDYFHNYYEKYWGYSNLKTYEDSLMPLLKKDGVIFLHYLFYYSPSVRYKSLMFCDSGVYADDLIDEELFSLNTNGENNGVILKKAR